MTVKNQSTVFALYFHIISEASVAAAAAVFGVVVIAACTDFNNSVSYSQYFRTVAPAPSRKPI